MSEKRIFQGVALDQVRRSTFDLSHERLQTGQMGVLYPNLLQEVVPGDTFQVNTEIMTRLAPMIGPLMHRIDIFQHYFFVPNRIVWPDWEEFITGGDKGDTTIQMPTVNLATYGDPDTTKVGSLWDMLGLPTNNPGAGYSTLTQKISQLPFRAYQLIYNEYYRDQNIVDEVDIYDESQIYGLRRRALEKDYGTSALPFAQKGPSVQLPISYSPDYRDVSRFIDEFDTPIGNNFTMKAGPDTVPGNTGDIHIEDGGGNELLGKVDNLNTQQESFNLTINDLRESNRLQQWLETAARAGSRYTEQLRAHFGVISSDARLQRPEYLGGGRQPVTVSEVLNTAADVSGTTLQPLGSYGGHGISVGSRNAFNKSFEEHGYIFGIMSIRPRTTYSSGIHRHWTRESRFDHFFPEFANLGEQAILAKEIFTHPNDDTYNDLTFGYQQRFAEYKYACSTFHGDFKKSGLNEWHLGRQWADTDPPYLDWDFIHIPVDNRIFAVDDGEQHQFWSQIYHNIEATRPMPYFAKPQL